MNDNRDKLIAALAADARPVKHPGRTSGLTLAWLTLAAVIALASLVLSTPPTVFRGPLLLSSPQFLLESTLGLMAIVALGLAAFRSGIPALPSWRAVWVGLLPFMAWIALHLLELWHPTFEASMVGKRANCWLEVLVAGLPGLMLGCYAMRQRLWPLRGSYTGALLGLASGAMPALSMQFICIHEPQHILAFHLAPLGVLGLAGAIAGAWVLRRP